MSQAEIEEEVKEAKDQGLSEDSPIWATDDDLETLPPPSYEALIVENNRLYRELCDIKEQFHQYKITVWIIVLLALWMLLISWYYGHIGFL